jgi:hypothetical protein
VTILPLPYVLPLSLYVGAAASGHGWLASWQWLCTSEWTGTLAPLPLYVPLYVASWLAGRGRGHGWLASAAGWPWPWPPCTEVAITRGHVQRGWSWPWPSLQEQQQRHQRPRPGQQSPRQGHRSLSSGLQSRFRRHQLEPRPDHAAGRDVIYATGRPVFIHGDDDGRRYLKKGVTAASVAS